MLRIALQIVVGLSSVQQKMKFLDLRLQNSHLRSQLNVFLFQEGGPRDHLFVFLPFGIPRAFSALVVLSPFVPVFSIFALPPYGRMRAIEARFPHHMRPNSYTAIRIGETRF